MVSYYSCDSCGNPIERGQPVSTVGYAIKRDYCPICAPKVDGYLLALKEAQVEAARFYAERRDALMKLLDQQSPGIRLPDVVYEPEARTA